MVTLEQLISFKTAYETSGYSSAGRVLGKDRATVREHIIALEIAIGKPLFNVVGKRLEPTPVAVRLYPKAKHITKQTEDFEHAALFSFDTDLPEIVLHYETFVSVVYLSRLEQEIRHRYPGLKIKLLHKNRDESMKALEEGEAHLAILTNRGDVFPSSAVGTTYLGAALLSPYAHPDSPLFDNDSVSVLDLSEEMQYVMENADLMTGTVMKHSSYQHVVSNTDLIVSLLQGGGWSGLNRLDAEKYVQAGWLKELKLRELNQPYSIGITLFYSYKYEANKTVREIKDLTRKVARQFMV